MSLYGALQSGVAGLDACSTAMSIASSNIVNVNTVGYKANTTDFSTLLAASAASGDAVQAGVSAHQSQNLLAPGDIEGTNSATDLAISGDGFFVVGQSPAVVHDGGSSAFFTRAGKFAKDAHGNWQNSAGYYLLGWRLDSQGNVPTDRTRLDPINLDSLSGKAEATSHLALQYNLQATTAVTGGYTAGDIAAGNKTADFERTVNVYDSLGSPQPLQIAFIKTGANQWNYEVTYQGPAANLVGPPVNNVIKTGTVTFNPDGTLANAIFPATPAAGLFNVTIPWKLSTSGLNSQTFELKMGSIGGSDGITQAAAGFTQGTNVADGALFGNLSGVTVGEDGIVTAHFSNGLTQNVFKVPLATFPNPDGLSVVSGNAYSASNDSGLVSVGEPNIGATGKVEQKSLEKSNVDLAAEFTVLITTQRAYAACAKTITTASSMLDDLLRIST